ncbi:MAG: hydrolase [Verrucomicrobia bacterium]|nr:MAG: hydrolase [Verrucomicrobiota bacterium]
MLKKYQKEVKPIKIDIKDKSLNGLLDIPEKCHGLIVFAHGSGSSRLSPRNQFVASYLTQNNFATLLFDLLTPQEEEVDMFSGEFRFNIELLADRLMQVTAWILKQPKLSFYKIGYFGSSTGAAAALIAASKYQKEVSAVVSRGGRPDMASSQALKEVKSPTILIVGSLDGPVIELNKTAQAQMQNTNELKIIPGATHLFEEPGKLEEVAKIASEWFTRYL